MANVVLLAILACRGPDVRIAEVHALRDLTLVEPTEGQPVWTSDAGDTVRGSRVPADRLWPGERWTVSVDGGTDAVTIPEPPGGNVLVVVLDDVGVDQVSAYGHPDAPATPTLDGLAEAGVRFDRAYASPLCSPTRAAALTGRHGRRTGIGWATERDGALPRDALTLPEALDDARGSEPVANAAIGKWHLAGPAYEGRLDHPRDSGFDHFAGLLGNPEGYDRWTQVDDGVARERAGYLTTAQIDDALDRIDALTEPWFLWLALSAAHEPWTRPPDPLLAEPLPDEPTDSEAYRAVLQALDRELGRLLAAIPEDTTVIVVGDNGTPGPAVLPPRTPEHQKGTLYEGGVHVPLVVAGPHVGRPGRADGRLVHVTDLFPTVAEILGVPLVGADDGLSVPAPEGLRALDGRSLLAAVQDRDSLVREHVYAEAFLPNGAAVVRSPDLRMLRDDRYKLVRDGDVEQLFDLDRPDDRPDGPDLVGEPGVAEARDRLARALDQIEAELVFEGR